MSAAEKATLAAAWEIYRAAFVSISGHEPRTSGEAFFYAGAQAAIQLLVDEGCDWHVLNAEIMARSKVAYLLARARRR